MQSAWSCDNRQLSFGTGFFKKMFVPLTKAFRDSLRPLRYLLTHSTARNDIIMQNVDPEQLRFLETELCVLVDEKDRVVGAASKKDCHRVSPEGRVPLHRAFSLFLFNGRGEIYVQRRSNKKVQFSGYYSNTICSHPLFIDGQVEDVKSAVKRKLHHELNVPTEQVDPSKMHLMTRILYHDACDGVWGEHEMDYIVLMQDDLDIVPNSDEIDEFYAVARGDFDDFVASLSGPVTPWFNMLRRGRLQHWWDNLHRLNEIATPYKIEKLRHELVYNQ